jgi:hypothetical protein
VVLDLQSVGWLQNRSLLRAGLVCQSLLEIHALLTCHRFAIVLTLGIYLRAGKDIWVKRKQLRNFDNNESSVGDTSIPEPDPLAGIQIQRTTNISINYENVNPTVQEIRHPHRVKAPMANTFTVAISGAQSEQSSRNEYPDMSDRISAVSVAPMPMPRPMNSLPPRKYTAVEANTAIWSYTKVSLLFFLAMMITWIPSSANRLFSLLHPGEISLGLAYTSALVLPLQGFWNATIYATTSLSACRELWANIKAGHPLEKCDIWFLIRKRGKRSSQDTEHHGASRSTRGSPGKSFADGDSLTELQPSRPTTKDSSCRP